jgi:hypothetical protein
MFSFAKLTTIVAALAIGVTGFGAFESGTTSATPAVCCCGAECECEVCECEGATCTNCDCAACGCESCDGQQCGAEACCDCNGGAHEELSGAGVN